MLHTALQGHYNNKLKGGRIRSLTTFLMIFVLFCFPPCLQRIFTDHFTLSNGNVTICFNIHYHSTY